MTLLVQGQPPAPYVYQLNSKTSYQPSPLSYNISFVVVNLGLGGEGRGEGDNELSILNPSSNLSTLLGRGKVERLTTPLNPLW